MAYAKFTPEMKKTYTILAPNMLPIHFHLLIRILEQFGYHVVLLESTSRTVVEEGLKNVHNDTCYPALLVVGQFMEALKSGKYDVDHTALLITQTGGGCRASNYIPLGGTLNGERDKILGQIEISRRKSKFRPDVFRGI